MPFLMFSASESPRAPSPYGLRRFSAVGPLTKPARCRFRTRRSQLYLSGRGTVWLLSSTPKSLDQMACGRRGRLRNRVVQSRVA